MVKVLGYSNMITSLLGVAYFRSSGKPLIWFRLPQSGEVIALRPSSLRKRLGLLRLDLILTKIAIYYSRFICFYLSTSAFESHPYLMFVKTLLVLEITRLGRRNLAAGPENEISWH